MNSNGDNAGLGIPEEYFAGIYAFPKEWWDIPAVRLKDSAPDRAKKIFEEWDRAYNEGLKKGVMVD